MPKISTFIFEFNFSNRYVPLNNLIPPELHGCFVVTGTALSLISCISSVDSSPNFFEYFELNRSWPGSLQATKNHQGGLEDIFSS